MACVGVLAVSQDTFAIRIRDICRVKGQEQNTLQGLGLVVGLRGTGDGSDLAPKIQALANALHRLGSPLGPGGFAELRNTKNVALVMVTATVPASGGRQGDQLDCTVTSIGDAKSLEGGYLMPTPLVGPFSVANVGKSKIYAFAQGQIHLDDVAKPNRSKVTGGARLEAEFLNPFIADRRFTLVLKDSHANFSIANEVMDVINKRSLYNVDPVERGTPTRSSAALNVAVAVDQKNIVITVPPEYDDELQFVAYVLELPLADVDTDARVTINRQTGTIVIHGNVEIGPAVISHGNIVIEAGNNVPVGDFVPLDTAARSPAKLQALLTTLKAIRLPPADIIEVIEGLEKNGNLHGDLLIE
jgi:flagellar P-ring protein precursor FlgI